jgi:hypothetical protein
MDASPETLQSATGTPKLLTDSNLYKAQVAAKPASSIDQSTLLTLLPPTSQAPTSSSKSISKRI